MKILISLLFFTSLQALAQNQGVKVHIVDPDIDDSSLKDKYQVTRTAIKSNTIPDRDLREKFLKDVSSTQNWDELKKDIFYMDLKNKSIKQLVKKYPEFKKSELQDLKNKRQ